MHVLLHDAKKWPVLSYVVLYVCLVFDTRRTGFSHLIQVVSFLKDDLEKKVNLFVMCVCVCALSSFLIVLRDLPGMRYLLFFRFHYVRSTGKFFYFALKLIKFFE